MNSVILLSRAKSCLACGHKCKDDVETKKSKAQTGAQAIINNGRSRIGETGSAGRQGMQALKASKAWARVDATA